MRILVGRRSRLQERLDQFRTSLSRTRERLDTYTLELQRHGLESVEHEVKWLDNLIDAERQSVDTASAEQARGNAPRAVTGETPVTPLNTKEI